MGLAVPRHPDARVKFCLCIDILYKTSIYVRGSTRSHKWTLSAMVNVPNSQMQDPRSILNAYVPIPIILFLLLSFFLLLFFISLSLYSLLFEPIFIIY